MTTTVRAVFQGGVFRPTEPPTLTDGTAVELTVTPILPPEELARRAEAVHRLEAFWAELAAEAGGDPDDGFDLFEALNRTRREEGRPPIPPEAWGRES